MSKQHEVIAEVLGRALHHLRELNVPCLVCLPDNQVVPVNKDYPFEPCVIVMQSGVKILVNPSDREADALIEDSAQFSCALREKMLEKRADDIVYENWKKDKGDDDV